MSTIKRYKLLGHGDFEVVVEIDHAVLTEEKLAEANSGFSCDTSRKHYGELRTFLNFLFRNLWFAQVESGGYTVEGLIDQFNWDRQGGGVEGCPKLDGSYGIRLIECAEVYPEDLALVDEVSV